MIHIQTPEDDFHAQYEQAIRDAEEDLATTYHDPMSRHDGFLAKTIAERALRDRYCWADGRGWLAYGMGYWTEVPDVSVAEAVRRDLADQVGAAVRANADFEELRRAAALLKAPSIRNYVSLARGILEVDTNAFDQHPDLLCVANGVVDLPTGSLVEHDPGLLMTKSSPVSYEPGALHRDWEAALQAVPAEVRQWLQVRFGQTATGHPIPDDVMCLLQGGGSNGKTTVTSAIRQVLGGHAVVVPERLLLSRPGDHSTELMTLRGARLAVLEETPEGGHLSVKRLKDAVGTPTITARHVYCNNVTWDVTHGLVMTTNYRPRVDETDEGTWRRLALVRFPYRFVSSEDRRVGEDDRVGIPGLRERLRDGSDGQQEAVLAWLVEGAQRWYAAGKEMPPVPAVVAEDTAAWRAEADVVFGFAGEMLVFEQGSFQASREVYEAFAQWMRARGHEAWADALFAARFREHEVVKSHGVTKSQKRVSGTTRAMVWKGVRLRRPSDDGAVVHLSSRRAS